MIFVMITHLRMLMGKFFKFLFFGHTKQHAESWFPDQGLNPSPLQWTIES